MKCRRHSIHSKYLMHDSHRELWSMIVNSIDNLCNILGNENGYILDFQGFVISKPLWLVSLPNATYLAEFTSIKLDSWLQSTTMKGNLDRLKMNIIGKNTFSRWISPTPPSQTQWPWKLTSENYIVRVAFKLIIRKLRWMTMKV